MSGAGEAAVLLQEERACSVPTAGRLPERGQVRAPVLRWSSGPATLPVVPAPISGSDTGPAPHLA